MLDRTDFKNWISKKDFRKQLPELEERIYCLQKASWDASLPVIVLLEGWETVRKGNIIRSLTGPLDPRGFVFHTIRSPLPHELARPWMWRFWLRIPERGQWAIFDQSWYRRVLFENFQNKISKQDLRRALRDINDFERTLSDDGALIIKFFLHTQKNIFKKSAGLSASAEVTDSKILSRRYDDLFVLYEDTLKHTQQDWAAWTILPADDKRTARSIFLQTIIKRLQQHLGVECAPKRKTIETDSLSVKRRTSKSRRSRRAVERTPAPEVVETLPVEVAQQQTLETPGSGEDDLQPEPQVQEQAPAKSRQSSPKEPGKPDENRSEAASIFPDGELL